MIVRKRVLATHHLEYREKNRRYVFRVLEDCVEVERWERGVCAFREAMDTAAARRRYAFLRTLGYNSW